MNHSNQLLLRWSRPILLTLSTALSRYSTAKMRATRKVSGRPDGDGQCGLGHRDSSTEVLSPLPVGRTGGQPVVPAQAMGCESTLPTLLPCILLAAVQGWRPRLSWRGRTWRLHEAQEHGQVVDHLQVLISSYVK